MLTSPKNDFKVQKYRTNFQKVRTKLKTVEEKDNIRNFQPPITGQEIIRTFNIEPSKIVGELKDKIKDAILDGKIKNNYDDAYSYMMEIAPKMGL